MNNCSEYFNGLVDTTKKHEVLIQVCAWAEDKKELEDHFRSMVQNVIFTHGICPNHHSDITDESLQNLSS